MTKYRRKTANAKERERMKMVNQAFDRLREVMPDLNLILDQEKETKVYTETRYRPFLSAESEKLSFISAESEESTFRHCEMSLDNKRS